MEKKRISLKLNKIPFEIEAEDGTVTDCELREMTAEDRDSYVDLVKDRVQLGPDGKPSGVSFMAGLQAELVSRCLVNTATGEHLAKDVVSHWPAAALGNLFTEAQKLNRLNEEPDKTKAEIKKP